MATRADRAWAAWTAAVVGSFFALEVPALIRGRREPAKPGGTLSYWLRGVLGVRDRRARRWVLGPLFAAGCAWLAAHMCLGWWNS